MKEYEALKAAREMAVPDVNKAMRRVAAKISEGKNMTDQKYMRTGLDFAVGKAIEEAGELQAALGKTLRWGWNSVNPELPPDKQEPNASWVRREIADVRGALDNLEREMEKNL